MMAVKTNKVDKGKQVRKKEKVDETKKVGLENRAGRPPTHPVHVFSAEGEKHLRRVRHICSGLPNTTEKLSHGSPTFFHKKVYCSFTKIDGERVAVWVPVPPGEQALLIRSAPNVYYKPPYVGVYGWVGIVLDQIEDEDLAVHLHDAWKMMGSLKTPSRRKTGDRGPY